jgi:HEPN domain-containing protein
MDAMSRRANDWFRQAEKDFQHSQNSFNTQDYEWSCFAAQQAAEKALKALYQHIGGESFGHSLLRMLRELPPELQPDRKLFKKAAELDKFYIATRYPNGFDWGAPMDYFDVEDAQKAIAYSEEIISYVKSQIFK